MKRLLSKLSANLNTDILVRNWDIWSLWIGSAVFLVILLSFAWTADIKLSVFLLVSFFNLLAFRFIKLEIDLRKEISAFVQGSVHTVETTDLRHFYLHMKAAIMLADHRVDVTRLEQTKPTDSHLQEVNDYYETVIRVVQKRSITFRRIIRVGTPDVLEWTIELLEQLGSCPNFNIAAFQDYGPGAPGALSLQIFDGKEVMLDQPDSVESSPQKHLLRIRGKRLAEAFSDYYEGVWKLSILIKKGNTIYWNNLSDMAQRLLAESKQKNDIKSSQRITASLDKLKELSGISTCTDG